jgi:chemotaxis protein CheC
MLLDEDQRDALTEVSNIGMGRAGEALSSLLDTFVVLSAPRVSIVDASEQKLGLSAPGQTDRTAYVTAVRQAFFADLHGESITVFGLSGDNDITIVLGEGAGEVRNEEEKILDATCIIVGALMSGLTEQLGLSVALTAPSILVNEGRLADLNSHLGGWDYALMIEVRLDIEKGPFSCQVFTLMPDQSIQKLRDQLDHLLEGV